ncbi:MAG: N-acetyltransferase family protein [Candidatus Aenigmatarchaeota archaeon]
MLPGKVIEEFEVDGKKARIQYEEMRDAEDYMELKNSLVEEGAKIGSQEKIDSKEAVEKVAGALKEIAKGEGIYLVLEVNGEGMGVANVSRESSGAQEHVGTSGIFLRREWREKGLGTKLMETLISEARSQE